MKLTNEQIRNKLSISLLPKQKKFIYHVLQNPQAKFVWYVGGFGSGKSFIGSYASILLSLIYPNNTGLISRNTLRNLKRTTQKTFFDILENVLGLTPDTGARKFSKSDQVIKFYNGSEIYFSGLDEIDKLKSLNLGFFYIDEVDEVKAEVFSIAQGRLRNPKVPRRVGFITSNSEGKNWTYALFIKGITPEGNQLTEKEMKYYYTLRASSLENFHLPPDYVETLLTYKGDKFKKYVLGSFDIFEGQIFSEFFKEKHVIEPFRIPQDRHIFYGMDHGTAHPTVFIEVRQDYDGNLYCTRLHYEREKPVKYHAQKLKERLKQLGLTHQPEIIADPSIFSNNQQPTPDRPFIGSIADEYNEHGIYLLPGNNDIIAGINRMKEMFADGKIKIFKGLNILIDEIEAYRRKKNNLGIAENKPDPKAIDHAIDALRYVVMTKAPPPTPKNQQLLSDIQKDIYYSKHPQYDPNNNLFID